MTDQPAEATPSVDVTPEMLDSAFFVLVIRADDSAYMNVSTTVADAPLADWLHTIAGMVAAGEHRRSCSCSSVEQHAQHTAEG